MNETERKAMLVSMATLFADRTRESLIAWYEEHGIGVDEGIIALTSGTIKLLRETFGPAGAANELRELAATLEAEAVVQKLGKH